MAKSKKQVLLLFLLISLASAYTTKTISSSVVLGWYFPTTATITFYLSVPTSNLSSKSWGYYGLGFKTSGSSSKMSGADCVIAVLSKGTVDSVACTGNNYTPEDSFSLSGITSFVNGTNTVYQWTRDLSGGTNHMTLAGGTSYKVIWCYGQYSGDYIQHSKDGSISLTLTYDAEAPGSSNSGGSSSGGSSSGGSSSGGSSSGGSSSGGSSSGGSSSGGSSDSTTNSTWVTLTGSTNLTPDGTLSSAYSLSLASILAIYLAIY
ncbi:unnamed protein product [Blepharisma stoltei]|uniref:DOMON domain-containing protein n=1 Tax=Blepharisma stoltei TaxID=1481888 RepID=A0AAU9JZ20_9CILI|nr:unnamed protein product [Blepharisma stoltei]